MTMPHVHLDFETYSAGPSVKDVGPAKYAEHPSTEVLCLAWALGDADPNLWVPGDLFPRELFRLIADGAELFAWNAEFELAIWAEQCHRRMGWPEVPFESWRDTAAVALTFGLPASLEDAGAALQLRIQKDPRGSYLLSKLSKPRSRLSKANQSPRWTPTTAPEDFWDLYRYCQQDVRTEREVGRVLPIRDLPPSELRYWRETVKMNSRGWAVDVDSATRMIRLLAAHRSELVLELAAITDGAVTSDGQIARILAWLRERGVTPMATKKGAFEPSPSLAADAVVAALAQPDLDPSARRVLEIRQDLAKSSTKKYQAMVDRACADGRVKNNILYHGAGTGRDAGRGLQIQNFPRASIARKKGSPEDKDLDIQRAFDALRTENPLETVDFLYGNPTLYASKMLRSHLVAAPGKRLYGADFSSIENRITVWYAQDRHGIDLFVRGLDQYRDFAAGHFGVPYEAVTDEQRQDAKAIVLGCCFQMGAKTFLETCARQGNPVTLEVAQKAVRSYRSQYPGVVALWSGLNRAAIAAVKYRQPTRYLKVGFEFSGEFLYLVQASGRRIAYYRPKVQLVEMPWEDETGQRAKREAVTCMCADEKTRVWLRRVIRPGRLTENAVQGTARDVMMHGSLGTIGAGYDLVGRVHDELVSEREDGTGSVEEYTRLMVAKPAWLDEIPIAAEGWSGYRYRK